MSLPKHLKNFNLTVDGRGKAGKCSNVTLPEIAIKTDEQRNGGMDASVLMDGGMNAINMEWTLAEYDPTVCRLVGLTEQGNTQITFRAATSDDMGTSGQIVVQARGKIISMKPSQTESGGKNDCGFTANLTYYKLAIDGETVIEIDIINMKRIIGGVDQLAAQRAALAL